MREILFRAKGVDSGKWVYGFYVSQYGAHEIVLRDGADEDGFESRHVIPETVCQWTGLTDKNGKKIFEGDILHIPCRPENDCIVEWSIGRFRFRWVNKDKRSEYGSDYNAVCCCQRVTEQRNIVGNIFDNPEIVRN